MNMSFARKILVVASLLFVIGSFGTTAAQQIDTQIEPQAGTWKTWVLASGSQLRRAAPPGSAATQSEIKQLQELAAQRDTAALGQVQYWNTGGPVYRWNEIAVNEALAKNLGAPPASRALALVHAAAYDAVIAAWDSKYTYNRPRPSEFDASLTTVLENPASPSYPSEHAAVAGATSTVLAYLFPEKAEYFQAQAAQATKSRLLAGVEYPSDVEAGMALGQEVAALVIERAKKDGSDAKWTGSVPTAPGKWNGTNPAAPAAGTWQTWVLKSGNELRPAAPPAYDSAQMAAELAELKNIERTPKMISDAFFWEYSAGGTRNYSFWNGLTTKQILAYGLDQNPPQQARAYAMQSVALYDAMVACWDGKYAYWQIRPFQLDPEFKPLFTTPNHPSYPAAHGCLSSAAAGTLAGLFPLDADSLNGLAQQAGESRTWAGIHYKSDVDAGLKLGRAVAAKVIDQMQIDTLPVATR